MDDDAFDVAPEHESPPSPGVMLIIGTALIGFGWFCMLYLLANGFPAGADVIGFGLLTLLATAKTIEAWLKHSQEKRAWEEEHPPQEMR